MQSVAHAGVSNPDYYFIDVPGTLDSIYDGGSGGGVFRLDGQLEGDLASDGSWTFGGASFTDVLTNVNAGGYVSARPIVVASGTYGTVDPDVPIVTLTLRMRIKISGGGVGTTCQTSLFTVTLSTTKSFLSQSGSYSVSTGQFLAGAQDFTVPAITTGCNSYESTLNNAFGFGRSAGVVAMKFDTASIATMLGQVPAR